MLLELLNVNFESCGLLRSLYWLTLTDSLMSSYGADGKTRFELLIGVVEQHVACQAVRGA